MIVNFATAALKFPVAMSSFGIQKVLSALPIGNSNAGRAIRANLYQAGEAAKKDFSTNTLLFGAFQFGDRAQTAAIDLVADALTLRAVKPSYLMNAVMGIVQGSTAAIGTISSANSRRLLREQFGNTFDVIGFVNHVDAPTELSADGTYPIDEMIDRMYSQGDYPALWLIEGLGERYAEAYMNSGRHIRGLLSTGKGASLPAKTQLMMHAGIGITFAKYALATLNPCSSEAEIGKALQTFLDLVDQNSQESCKGAALESLGLVTRTWYSQMVGLIYRNLSEMDPAASEFFWHGAGRAMYFSPMYMLPGFSPWNAAEQEPPNETARRNARAGVAWAFTVVNIRHPEITANFLGTRAAEIAGNDAFTDGVYSTLIMAGDMVPGHPFVRAYGEYAPDSGNPAAVDAWNKYIGPGCDARIDSYRRILKASGKLGEVFRYHNLPEYVARLEAAQAAQAAARPSA